MDRKFIIEKEYCNNIHNVDGCLIKNALKEFCPRNLDTFEEISLSQLREEKDSFINTGLKVIPVGTLEFVTEFLSSQQNKDIQLCPIEVPEVLQKYLHRNYKIAEGRTLTKEEKSGKYFLKDASVLKLWNNSLNIGRDVSSEINPEHLYVVTEAVEFESEWRLFVYNNRLLGAECYQGDAGIFPFQYTVRNMISDYSRTLHPKAYTIDVGIRWHRSKTKGLFLPPSGEITEPIEVHPFVACGLYGFYDRELLSMWEVGYDWYKNFNNYGNESAN